MDTVRADRVSGYGSTNATPGLAEIADRGVLFRRSYAASSYTIPSHMSIFTGLDPAEHGGHQQFAQLGPDVPTMASLFQDAGYRTRGFHEGVSARVDRVGRTGLAPAAPRSPRESLDDKDVRAGEWDRIHVFGVRAAGSESLDEWGPGPR